MFNGHEEVAGYFFDQAANVNLLHGDGEGETIFAVASKIHGNNSDMVTSLNRKAAERLRDLGNE